MPAKSNLRSGTPETSERLPDMAEESSTTPTIKETARSFVGSLARSSLIILMISTVAGLLVPGHWTTDLLADLRAQQVMGLLLVAILAATVRRFWLVSIALLLTAVHLPWFASAIPTRLPAEGAADLKIMSVNVLTSNRQFDRVIAEVDRVKPDVFAVIELGNELAERLESLDRYPYRVATPQQPGNFGIGIYSRFPLTQTSTFTLNLDSVVSVAATVEAGSDYRMIATHPIPPLGSVGHQARNSHLEQLAGWLHEDRQLIGLPQILVGDFNLVPWSPVFEQFEQDAGLTRVARGHGVEPTWYAYPLFPMGLVIDHGLISTDLSCRDYEVGEDVGSDHRPIIFSIANQRRVSDAD